MRRCLPTTLSNSTFKAADRARSEGIDIAPVTLATASTDGRPSARIVLIRHVDSRGFVFFTNYGSRKAREIEANPQAALCQHWPKLEEQIRIEGRVERVNTAESDAYFSGRPRESQLGAWASDQSAELPARNVLEQRYREVESRFHGAAVTRPPFWGGLRVVPERMEFWFGRPGRLHERVAYTRPNGSWTTVYLFP